MAKKIAEKNNQNHFRSNNDEVCKAVACYFPNDLDVMAFETVNLSSDKIEQQSLWSNDTD
jgi:hypothetical protein